MQYLRGAIFATSLIIGFGVPLAPSPTFAQSTEQTDDKDSGQQTSDEETSDEESSLDEQLSELESEVTGEERDGGNSTSNSAGGTSSSNNLNPDLSVILDTGAAWQSDQATLVGGPDPKSFGFFLQSTELAVQADVDPYVTFDAHLVAKLSGLKIGEAYGTTLALPASLQARFGKFKTRFGRVNPLHLHAWHFTALPLVNGKMFGPAGLNGLGAEISQLLPLPWYVEWVLAVQDLASPKTGVGFLRDPAGVEDPLDFVASARLKQFFELSSDWSLLFGLNGAIGRNDSGGLGRRDQFRTDIYGADLFLKWKSSSRGGRSEVGWQTEFVGRKRQTPDDSLVDLGGYSYLYWSPTRRWEFGGRYEYVTGPLDSDDDYLHPNWIEDRQRAGAAVTFYPTEFSRFRLEYMGNRLDDGFDDLGHVVLLQAQLVTGAHGAHKF